MPKKEAPISHLQNFLPPNTYEAVLDYLHRYHVHLTVAQERKSILVDYGQRTYYSTHSISVNGNLNKYAFLITLIHEIAHLLQFEQFGNKVASHGREWKNIFGQLLAQFIQNNIFPDDIKDALLRSINNPSASSCADDVLLRTLKKYDERPSHLKLVEDLPSDTVFKTHDGKIFRKGQKLRKRFQCVEIKTGKLYLFSPVYEVELVS